MIQEVRTWWKVFLRGTQFPVIFHRDGFMSSFYKMSLISPSTLLDLPMLSFLFSQNLMVTLFKCLPNYKHPKKRFYLLELLLIPKKYQAHGRNVLNTRWTKKWNNQRDGMTSVCPSRDLLTFTEHSDLAFTPTENAPTLLVNRVYSKCVVSATEVNTLQQSTGSSKYSLNVTEQHSDDKV